MKSNHPNPKIYEKPVLLDLGQTLSGSGVCGSGSVPQGCANGGLNIYFNCTRGANAVVGCNLGASRLIGQPKK